MRALCRILPTMAAMLASLCAFADRVPEQKAAETAAAFFLQSDVKFSTAVRAVASRRSTEVPAYRAYNREGGGFVVIAGDDSVEPILAYSPDGVFPSEEEMPENMAWWFGMIADQIKSIPAGRKASAEIKARWEAPASSFRSASNLLYDTATWGQRAPFNNLCPESGGERCVAGCEAVAGATIARYYRWPDRGVGTVDANIWSDSPDYPAHDLGYEYDYDNMPLEYGRNYTTEQANAVATLVYDMGTVAKMSYGVKGSFTYDMYLLEGLKNHMKYNRSAYLAKRKVYSDEQWISLLKEHLDEYGPTVYSGADSGGAGGHAFVIDGYDEQDRFHFNWGWNGSSNCYCIITEMVPTGQPYNFINDQSVMIDLIPDRDGSSVIRDILYFSGDERYSGITANTDSFSQNVSFNCNCGWIASMTGAFEGKFCLALYDKYGNFKQDISGTIEITIQPNKMRGFSCTCTITETIAPGDRIMLRFEGKNNDGIVEYGEEGCATYIIVMEDTGEDPTAGYTAAEIAATTSLSYVKSSQVVTINLQHPANWSVKNASGTTVASGVAAVGGAVSINTSGYAAGKYTVSVGSATDPFTFTFTK